ncbi:Uncharacterized protein OBRU01_17197, partial [Operophtera brumata]
MSSRNPNTLMSVPDEQFDYLFKIVLIGDCGTGKTCIVQRLKSGNFIERHGNTIGVDFSMKTLIVDGKKVKYLPATIVTVVYLLLPYLPSNYLIIHHSIYQRQHDSSEGPPPDSDAVVLGESHAIG